MVRVFRRTIPLFIDVISRAAMVNHIPIAPNHGLCANVPFMRFLFFKYVARHAHLFGPLSCSGLQANSRRFVLRRGRIRRLSQYRYGRLFVAYAVDNDRDFLRRASLLNRYLTSGVCRVMFGVVIAFGTVNCKGRRTNDFCRLLQAMMVFRFQPTKRLMRVFHQANAGC